MTQNIMFNLLGTVMFAIVLATYTSADLSEELQKLNTTIPLPGNITVPTQEEAEKVLKEKCIKNGGQAAYDRVQGAKDRAQECVKQLVNMEELQQEMDAATPSGDLDLVFKKYCKKSPALVNCINDFSKDFEPCLEEAEKGSKAVVMNVTESLVNFICYKEGDRIALFIAEGGPQCLNASQEAIKTCVQNTFSKHVVGEPTVDNLPVLMFQAENCMEFSNLQKCVVDELEKCKEPTPANIVDSLFKFVRKVTPCSNFTTEKTVRGSGVAHSTSLTLVLTAISYAIFRFNY